MHCKKIFYLQNKKFKTKAKTTNLKRIKNNQQETKKLMLYFVLDAMQCKSSVL